LPVPEIQEDRVNLVAIVRSGGQEGVDVAGVRAAKRAGYATGGVMPKGFRTLAGPRPEYAELFGMTEHSSSDWGPRTDENVRTADFTLRVAENLCSPGERRTLAAIDKFKKPHADFRLTRVRGELHLYDVMAPAKASGAIQALAHHLGRPIVLNVAGNSERTAPGIEAYAEELLYGFFCALRG
jgi:hypothetical protein